VLCPSFYKASIINNPDRNDTRKQKWRQRVIGFLQRRHARTLASNAAGH
jgi:indolepyruvate ferredoxin oxidoreductase alpha subunit